MKFDKDGNLIDEEDEGQLPGTERADGDAGDGDETERALAGKQADDEGKTDERDASADQLGDDPVKLKRAVEGLTKRLKKVTGQRNSAREQAGEIAALKAEIAKLSARREEGTAREQRSNTPAKEEVNEEKARASVIAALKLVGLSPEQIQQVIDRQEEQDAAAEARDTEEARGFLRDEMEAHGLDSKDAKLFKRLEFSTGSEMFEDKKLLAAYRDPSTRRAAIRVAFERVRDGLTGPVLASLGVDKRLQRIERNKDKVLGGNRQSATADVGEPEQLTPPPNLKGDALADWWKAQVRKTAEALANEDA